MNHLSLNRHPNDTIAAIATPPGRGGVGVIRISGPLCREIAAALLGKVPAPRHALYQNFRGENQHVIDQGLALYFPAPNSFTGEDVLELHAHGSPIALDMLLQRLLQLGARLAKPGEFSERAFLNGKIDLAQAEAIADLINAQSEQAVQSALHSLQGEFSAHIRQLTVQLTALRIYVEAAIDFVDEEIDFLSRGEIEKKLTLILAQLKHVQNSAQQGRLLQEGITLAIAGRPNAGKSSLLNRLSGQDSAIVTEVPGTTRDVLRERIQINGLPLHIIDTAGLRKTEDRIEQEGIKRALQAIEQADQVLLIIDASKPETSLALLSEYEQLAAKKLTLIYNKIDLMNEPASISEIQGHPCIKLSAKTGQGLDLLSQHLQASVHFAPEGEGQFSARRRHLDAIARAEQHLQAATPFLKTRVLELLAEELSQAQRTLGEITGAVHADDLLGKIFSSFCIGK